jgi:glutamate-1-semialdehyde 2,1-aminomutase
MDTEMPGRIDPAAVQRLHGREVARFVDEHPRSLNLSQQARTRMPGGVPMSWMVKWPGPYPVFVAEAAGAHFRDVDGHDYVDLCLGDTGAMTGHSPPATVAAVREQAARGITAMLPTEDSITVSAELARRFRLPLWQFTLSATDANRHAIRYARHVTGRPKIVVHDFCYHGSVDETFATRAADGSTVSRRGNIGAPVDLDKTTIAVDFNDVDQLEQALATGEVAAVLAEPALTNVGIVLPEPGYHDALRGLTRSAGTLLILDETHTLSAGPGGYSGLFGLDADLLTMGKAIAGGIPAGAFGMTQEVADRIAARVDLEDIDVGGIGGTLAGNALSLAAMRATLTEVLTEQAYGSMTALGDSWADGVDAAVAAHGLPWHCNRLGARAEYTFTPGPPRTGAQAHAAGNFALEQLLHLYALNRGILLTPFHNMALMSPATTQADVDRHTAVFGEMVGELTG